jgi:hypothetical protein
MSHIPLRSFLLGLVGLLALNACVPFAARTSAPSADEIEARVATSVALTVSAIENTRQAVPSATATFTEIPSPTPLPTLTPLPPTATIVVRTPYPYACDVFNKVPYDNSVFHVNTNFDIKFSLRNIGTKTWGPGADLRYSGGPNLLTANIVYELPAVKPGETVGPYVYDAKTPGKPGTYVMTFKLQGGFCRPYVRIVVKR